MKTKKIVAVVGATTLVATLALGGSAMAAEVEGKLELPQIFRTFRGGDAPADFGDKLGIDLSGKTKEEITELMKAKQLEELKAALVEKGVDVSGLTEEQLYEKAKELGLRAGRIELKERGDIEGLGEKLGIDLSGKTKEEIAELIKAKQLEELKAALVEKGVDVSGLTEEQLYEKAKELGLRVGRFELNDREPMDIEGLGERLGIDLSGKTKEEIAELIKAKQLEELKAALVEKGVDVSGLTEEQLYEKAKEMGLRVGRLELKERGENGGFSWKLDIDASGKIAVEMSEEMKAKQLEAFKAALTEKGIDISGLTDEEIFKKAMANGVMPGGMEIRAPFRKEFNDGAAENLKFMPTNQRTTKQQL